MSKISYTTGRFITASNGAICGINLPEEFERIMHNLGGSLLPAKSDSHISERNIHDTNGKVFLLEHKEEDINKHTSFLVLSSSKKNLDLFKSKVYENKSHYLEIAKRNLERLQPHSKEVVISYDSELCIISAKGSVSCKKLEIFYKDIIDHAITPISNVESPKLVSKIGNNFKSKIGIILTNMENCDDDVAHEITNKNTEISELNKKIEIANIHADKNDLHIDFFYEPIYQKIKIRSNLPNSIAGNVEKAFFQDSLLASAKISLESFNNFIETGIIMNSTGYHSGEINKRYFVSEGDGIKIDIGIPDPEPSIIRKLISKMGR